MSPDEMALAEESRRTGTPVEVRLTESTLAYIDERVALAVEKGIGKAMNHENAKAFWMAGLDVLRTEAQDHAGRIVIGGIRGLISKAFTFLVLGGIVYAVGGWSALGRLWSFLFHSAT
ncbi:hypothetical protein BN948_01754 [Hydrogenophaga intermedia]|uniref:Transmembrane protein n=1 Tax=Hydrogenophaga intermedia TaxID=65786 RepID=A0A1L1PEV4_HYDIT|nr:hypothetical protein [Hydrogenophaga intermedia]CDN87334.1 hypothetical protein BN948_01754 [Hydrogenophaga intermedia]